MTLKARNRFTLAFSVLYAALSALVLFYFFYKLNLVANGQASFNCPDALKNAAFLSPSILSLVISTAFMALYIPAVSFYIHARFEKTPSSEVAYIVIFLLGCVPEFSRALIPLETSPGALPGFLVVAGRALFWGRILSPASLFAASILPSKSAGLETEQNIFILLIFSLALANIAPMNTTRVSQSFSVQAGWSGYVNFICAVLALLTLASCAVNASLNENPLYLRVGAGFLCAEAGLFILNASAVPAVCAAGAALLFAGTAVSLSALHKAYAQ